jgi:hypothetical protein
MSDKDKKKEYDRAYYLANKEKKKRKKKIVGKIIIIIKSKNRLIIKYTMRTIKRNY